MPLQAFGKFLSGHGIPITGIVTEARFDTAEAVPVLKFRAVRPLSKEEWELGKAQSLTEDARQAVELKMVPSKAEGMPALPQSFKEAPAAVKAEAETVAEPVKRAPAKAKPEAPAPAKNVSDILSDWATDEDA
jgi:cell division protein FtsN